jgi:hypothetical protein
MATKSVMFKRKWGGSFINCWVVHPDTTEKLIFTNGFAASALDDGTNYQFMWFASGEAGSELTIEFKVGSGKYREIVKEWKMPAGGVPGEILSYQDSRPFKLKEA